MMTTSLPTFQPSLRIRARVSFRSPFLEISKESLLDFFIGFAALKLPLKADVNALLEELGMAAFPIMVDF